MTAREFHPATATPGPGLVEICWTFQVKCGPGVPIAETGVWGDRFTMTDLPPGLTNKEVGERMVKYLGQQFLETFLNAMGHEATDSPGGFLKHKSVSITVKDIPHE